MSIFNDDYISEAAQFDAAGRNAINEGLTHYHAQRVIKAGDTVVELGGNQGDLTKPFAVWAGATGRVHVFEPNPQHWAGLLAIGENVRLWPFAAGHELAIQTLSVPDGLHGWASLNDLTALLPGRTFTRHTTVSVPVSGIAEIRHSLPSFIKIDVEGYEIHALNGMKSVIEKARPVIIFENWTASIARFFDSFDYRIYDLFGRPANRSDQYIPNQIALPAARLVADVVSCGPAEFGLLERARLLR